MVEPTPEPVTPRVEVEEKEEGAKKDSGKNQEAKEEKEQVDWLVKGTCCFTAGVIIQELSDMVKKWSVGKKPVY